MDQARIDAKARGEKVYEGKPCKHEGHGNARYVSTGGCLVCGRKSALDAYHKRRDRELAPAVAQVLGETVTISVEAVPDIA
jgi:hypothetical protein